MVQGAKGANIQLFLTSHFSLPTSHFSLLTSHFSLILPPSHLALGEKGQFAGVERAVSLFGIVTYRPKRPR